MWDKKGCEKGRVGQLFVVTAFRMYFARKPFWLIDKQQSRTTTHENKIIETLEKFQYFFMRKKKNRTEYIIVSPFSQQVKEAGP